MSALTQVKVNQVLIGNPGFFSQALEIFDNVNSQPKRYLLFEMLGIRILPAVHL